MQLLTGIDLLRDLLLTLFKDEELETTRQALVSAGISCKLGTLNRGGTLGWIWFIFWSLDESSLDS